MNNKLSLILSDLILLFVLILIAFGCQQKSTIEANQETNNEESIWQQTALDSLTIQSLTAHPNASIFAASCCRGIFRSTDRGVTWTLVNKNYANVLAVHANGSIFAAYSGFVFRSMDNGETWIRPTIPPRTNNVRVFAFNSIGEIFAGSAISDESGYGGVYRSVDGGNTWLETGFPDTISVVALAINKREHIFAGTSFGVFRSFDNGQNWHQVNNGLRNYGDGPNVSNFAIDPISGNIFVAIEFDGIYRSINNGDNWSLVGLDLPNSMLPYLLVNSFIFNSQGHALAGCGGYFVEPEGVFYSTDNGETWSQINNGLTSRFIFSLAVDELGYVYAGTYNHGVFRTTKATITK